MNRRIPLRIAGLLGIALALASAGFAASAQTEDPVRFEIPPQPLSDALILFGDQSGQGVMADSVATETLDSPGYTGEAVPETALRQLLEGTGLTYRQDGDVFVILSPASSSVAGQNQIGQRQPGIEEIIVTGQKREERIQDVPIAISAFSPEDLEAQKIEGGFDLLKGVPNVSFTKTNFTGYNFQIRGIGTQAVSATTDPGVAVSFNNTTLIVNRLFEQEYLDVERVEVLRGPQGTLFGRNATAGVINVITNKPELGVWDGMIDVEVGNYNTRRLRGFFNAPIGDEWAIRGAYASTKRDGYGINEAAGDPNAGSDVSRDVDDRDLWTGRLTLGWQPSDTLRFNLLWERFEEDDHRVRTSKQLCHHDPGPEAIGSANLEGLKLSDTLGFIRRDDFSQGCRPGSLYSDEAFGTVNGASVPLVTGFYFGPLAGNGFLGSRVETGTLGGNPAFSFGDPFLDEIFGLPAEEPRCEDEASFVLMFPINICNMNPYADPETGEPRKQSRDLRTIFSLIQPEYRAKADIVELSFDWEWTDELLFSSQTVYVDDEYSATQDFNRYTTFPLWNDSTLACDAAFEGVFPNCNPDNPFAEGGQGTFANGFYADTSPGGVVCDPQLGCSDTLVAQDLARSTATQYNQEFRLVSSYPGDWNFSIGANYTKFRTRVDYFVFSNGLTHLLNFFPFHHHESRCITEGTPGEPDGPFCRYIDPNPLEDINGEGHNYFRSANPYKLTSSALFGELYWNATDTVKVTLGLRMTWDEKTFTPIPSQLLLSDYRDNSSIQEGDPPSACRSFTGEDTVTGEEICDLAGNAVNGRGSPASPAIEQEWNEPTGRLVVDWQPVLGFTDETLVYASFSRGYKGGGANPPAVAPPSRFTFEKASAAESPPTFEPEFVNAYELGTKNTLFGGAVVLNGAAFYYDYTGYQVSKIVDRRAVNENFDTEIWGAELEAIFAPSLNWQFNAVIGWLQTEVGEGEKSIDLMDRVDGGNWRFANPDGDFPEGFDDWMVIKPWITSASNCVVPAELMEAFVLTTIEEGVHNATIQYCPAGGVLGSTTADRGPTPFLDENGDLVPRSDSERTYDPTVDAPNGGAGFFKDLSGNELPNSPEFTVALGAQYNFDLTRDWRATARVDYYWQDQSYARIYNFEPYDRLKSWSNTNLSFWATHAEWGITVEGYVKNVFDETPITGTFLNSDDTGLTTNVFTLDPRLIGVSIRKEF